MPRPRHYLVKFDTTFSPRGCVNSTQSFTQLFEEKMYFNCRSMKVSVSIAFVFVLLSSICIVNCEPPVSCISDLYPAAVSEGLLARDGSCATSIYLPSVQAQALGCFQPENILSLVGQLKYPKFGRSVGELGCLCNQNSTTLTSCLNLKYFFGVK